MAILAKHVILAGQWEDDLKGKSNAELAELLMKHVWGEMDMFSFKGTLVDVVVDRLRNMPPSIEK